MHLYDSLTQRLQPVVGNDGVVTVYSCGPTVYDYPHLGNWYAFLRWDLLIRTLKLHQFQPRWVMNITDVGHLTSDADDGEDKLAQRAQQQQQTAQQLAAFYTDYFIQALHRLNFTLPTYLPQATAHISEQIALVQALEKLGYTYLIDDGVYYDTSRLTDYGKLAHGRIDPDQQQARISANSQKRHPSDFALWKLTPAGQTRDMEWDSPWGRGFPGWHIECSAMCQRYLGNQIDIHAGGIDHIPIHHTNELAQSEPVFGQPLAKIWLHSHFVKVDGVKMSKSLNNFYTLEDLEVKNYNLSAVRLAVFSYRYDNEANFTDDLMQHASLRLKRLQALAVRRYQLQEVASANVPAQLQQALADIKTHLGDNLNSSAALEKLDPVCQQLAQQPLSRALANHLVDFCQMIDDIFGTQLLALPDLNDQQQTLLQRRARARADNNFELADQLRQQLGSQGVEVNDTATGQLWQFSL